MSYKKTVVVSMTINNLVPISEHNVQQSIKLHSNWAVKEKKRTSDCLKMTLISKKNWFCWVSKVNPKIIFFKWRNKAFGYLSLHRLHIEFQRKTKLLLVLQSKCINSYSLSSYSFYPSFSIDPLYLLTIIHI